MNGEGEEPRGTFLVHEPQGVALSFPFPCPYEPFPLYFQVHDQKLSPCKVDFLQMPSGFAGTPCLCWQRLHGGSILDRVVAFQG